MIEVKYAKTNTKKEITIMDVVNIVIGILYDTIYDFIDIVDEKLEEIENENSAVPAGELLLDLDHIKRLHDNTIYDFCDKFVKKKEIDNIAIDQLIDRIKYVFYTDSIHEVLKWYKENKDFIYDTDIKSVSKIVSEDCVNIVMKTFEYNLYQKLNIIIK